MKFVLGLAAVLAFATIQTAATPVMAQQGKSAAESGSNATDTKSAGKSGGAMKGKSSKKKKKM